MHIFQCLDVRDQRQSLVQAKQPLPTVIHPKSTRQALEISLCPLGLVAEACKPSICGAEAGGLMQVWGQTALHKQFQASQGYIYIQ